MKNLLLKYFSPEDVLYIQLGNKKSSIGDEEFQEDVVLFRNPDNAKQVTGIEIQQFNEFKENYIQIDKKIRIDFAEPLKKIRMLISLRDIMFTDPKQFEETLEQWGIKIIKKTQDAPTSISIQSPCPTALHC